MYEKFEKSSTSKVISLLWSPYCSSPKLRTGPGGGGGALHYEMPGCVYLGSENVPIMKDALGQISYPLLKGSSAHVHGVI